VEAGCKTPGCERPYYARGWCHKDYQWQRANGLPPLPRPNQAERFWAKVDQAGDGCQPFTGAKNPKGYGLFHANGDLGLKDGSELAHHVAWALTYGPIASGLHVLHHCDNPPCCRLDHLWVGTNADNRADMIAKGRGKVTAEGTCRRGHPFDEANTYIHRGIRSCRACRRLAGARKRARRRAKRNGG
jgi:hypothetical protein